MHTATLISTFCFFAAILKGRLSHSYLCTSLPPFLQSMHPHSFPLSLSLPSFLLPFLSLSPFIPPLIPSTPHFSLPPSVTHCSLLPSLYLYLPLSLPHSHLPSFPPSLTPIFPPSLPPSLPSSLLPSLPPVYCLHPDLPFSILSFLRLLTLPLPHSPLQAPQQLLVCRCLRIMVAVCLWNC